jgi:hypothetical protein
MIYFRDPAPERLAKHILFPLENFSLRRDITGLFLGDGMIAIG